MKKIYLTAILLFLIAMTGIKAQNWNFSKHTVNTPGDTTWVWSNWFTAWSTENKTMNGITAYGTGKTINVSRSAAALPDYIYRIKLDKGTEGLDANGKPLYRAVGFPVTGKGTLSIVMTSGSSTAKGTVKLYHFNETNTPKTTMLTTFDSPDMSVSKFEAISYNYTGGAGELIISSGSSTQGTNLLEITWTPEANALYKIKNSQISYIISNKTIFFNKEYNAELLDLSGKFVVKINNLSEISIENIPKGIYILKVNYLTNTFVEKITI